MISFASIYGDHPITRNFMLRTLYSSAYELKAKGTYENGWEVSDLIEVAAGGWLSSPEKNEKNLYKLKLPSENYNAGKRKLDFSWMPSIHAFEVLGMGNVNKEFNPNGSSNNIAGILNESKNILGMMPHPERLIDPLLSGEDGSILFESLNKSK